MMEEMFKEIGDSIPKELMRDEKLSDGSTIKRMGPFVYGYSMTMRPDGKPEIREFGNIKPTKETTFGIPRKRMDVKAEREPLVDIVEEENTLKIIAEVPEVKKDEIELGSIENSLIISVDTEKQKYHKEIELPSKIDLKKMITSYRNGVLEISLPKVRAKPKGRKINID
jgi:HSP20 family protein